MKLILVRHGATEWSVSGRHTGRTDIPLLDSGRIQASEVAHRVRDLLGQEEVSLFSSPLSRARDTADIILDTVQAEQLVLDDRLLEYDYGEYEGLTTAEIRATRPGWTVFDGCPGGETVADVEARVDSFLTDVRASGMPLAIVFAHGHLLRILAARAIGQPGQFAIRLGLDTASVGVISEGRDGPAITLWNETAHG